jgi:hypothetical protein
MDLDSRVPPLENSARIRRRATEKLPDDQIADELHKYFGVVHSTLSIGPGRPTSYKISDAFTLLVNAADVFSSDPVRFLLSLGFVVFPESICLNCARLSEFLVVSPDWLSRALSRDEFRVLDRMPQRCIGKLEQLGFIDSDQFLLFTIPETGAFAFSLRKRCAVVQPFPTEFIDVLVLARAALVEQSKQRVRAYVEEVMTRARAPGCD